MKLPVYRATEIIRHIWSSTNQHDVQRGYDQAVACMTAVATIGALHADPQPNRLKTKQSQKHEKAFSFFLEISDQVPRYSGSQD